MHPLFLWSDIGKKTGVGGLEISWHGGPWDKVYGYCVSLAVVLDALGEASELPSIGRIIGFSVGSVE